MFFGLLGYLCCLRGPPGDVDFAEANRAFNKPDAPENREHLNEAIASYTKAIDAWGPTHKNYPTAHVHRALARLWLYELNGKSEAETLRKIIDDDHAALRSWQETNTTSAPLYLHACCSLGTAYRLLQPITRDLENGRNAVKYHEKALKVSEALRTDVLFELGTSRWKLSEMAKTDEELDDAIKNLKEVLEHCKVDDNSRARCLYSLAGAYNVRHALKNDSSDLEIAITFYQQALESPHLKPADKPAACLQLSRSLAFQKEHGDLAAAISEVGKSLALIGNNNIQHPLYADAQEHLGDLYWLQFRDTVADEQDLNDLRLAIQAYHAALMARRAPSTLFNIATVHFRHFQKTSNKEDLLAAKGYAEEAQRSYASRELSVKIQELLEDLAETSKGRIPMRARTYQSIASQE